MQPSLKISATQAPQLLLDAPYKKSFEPIPRKELDAIRCFFYINPMVAEEDLQQFDNWFLQLRRKPEVYSISRYRQVTFHATIGGDHEPVDWLIYRTWANTFHLRYEEILKAIGLKATSPFIHPEKQFMVTAMMLTQGVRPKALAECTLPSVLS
ncbi:hypothetical protein [Pseudomonas sp. UBA7530]|uniref:hypothetical protein n=1 Tax=Pseudomonas sp. UBA7530 TaxID=1947341 RepID=UPI0025F6AA80|nr:hypothetical protein [Pseudomonas sp. UBA7530]